MNLGRMPKKPELSDADQAIREQLGAAIRIAAAVRNKKPIDLAHAGGVSLAHQYRIESGERTPDALYLIKISHFLGASIDDLLAQASDASVKPKAKSSTAEIHVGGSHSQHSSGDGSIQIGSIGSAPTKRRR